MDIHTIGDDIGTDRVPIYRCTECNAPVYYEDDPDVILGGSSRMFCNTKCLGEWQIRMSEEMIKENPDKFGWN